jgi:DNA-binding transcriptional LysR family regulator
MVLESARTFAETAKIMGKNAQISDWDDLRHFVALAEAGSLSAAARRLGAEHSTVARRVAALEASLGLRLFDRMPRGYALTAEGEALADQARRLEAGVLAMERFAGGQGGTVSGSVRISAPPVLASRFIAPRLVPLRARHPGLLIELVGDSQAASLTRREADIAVRLSRPEEGALIARRLGSLGYGLYGAAAHLDGRRREAWDWLGYHEELDQVPQQRWVVSLARGRPLVFRTNDLGALLTATVAGLGVAALPCFLGDAEEGLRRLPEDGRAARRDIWLLVHADLRRSARVRAVLDHLVAIFEGSRARLAGIDAPLASGEAADT